MNTFETLTLRSNAVLARLATLQRRAERLPPSASTVVAGALAELNVLLQHLQVATEQMEAQASELTATQRELATVRQQLQDYLDAVPVPCVWTTALGEIDAANAEGARALNVSAGRLSGRSFRLFIAERDRLAEALAALNGGTIADVEFAATLRPRERRARAVRLAGRRLEHDPRVCWFLLPPEPSVP